MFVVAIFEETMIEDYYPVDNFIGLFETTDGAKEEIASLLYQKKLANAKAIHDTEVYKEFVKIHGYPENINEFALKTKPQYDHTRQKDKEYNKEHIKAVEKWKAEQYPIYQHKCDLYRKLKEEFYLQNQKTFSKDEIDSIKMDNNYFYRIIEVGK